MSAPKLPLVVPPTTAVAHAAAHFSAGPGARLRFRAHDEPCCFYIDVRRGPEQAPRSYLVLASPEAGGSRLEFPRDLGDAATVVTALFAVGLVAATWHTFGALALVLALPSALLLRVAAESTDADAEQAEVFAALAAAFEPLRRDDTPSMIMTTETYP
jgi:hypothetical protein